MFGWRKKPEGFEWHKYIRTTVKVRREQRRERILQARRSAAHQFNAAGVALAAGSRAAGVAAKEGARAGIGAAGLAAQGASSIAATLTGMALDRLGVLLRPLVELLARPNIGGPLALAGGIALGSGIGRYRGMGLDREALITLIIGVTLLTAALPMISRMIGIGPPRFAWLGAAGRKVALAAAVVAIAGGIGWVATRGKVGMPKLAATLPLIGESKPLQGRAQAVSGELLRVGRQTVRLAGIEAPEREQTCGNSNKRWRCGRAAISALARLADGRYVQCKLSGNDSAGHSLGYCVAGKTDINGELVRQGHVFAETGLFARYATLENEARAAKAGLWSSHAERPSDYRAKVWAEAKKRAPDGCPIKGLITGEGRVYVLPWSSEYDRGRIQRSKGERWFCSEKEAVGAGWRPALSGL